MAASVRSDAIARSRRAWTGRVWRARGSQAGGGWDGTRPVTQQRVVDLELVLLTVPIVTDLRQQTVRALEVTQESVQIVQDGNSQVPT